MVSPISPLTSENSHFCANFWKKIYCVKKKEHCSEFKLLNFKMSHYRRCVLTGCLFPTRASTRSVCLPIGAGRNSKLNWPSPSPTPKASAWSDPHGPSSPPSKVSGLRTWTPAGGQVNSGLRHMTPFVFIPSEMKRGALTWNNRVETTGQTRRDCGLVLDRGRRSQPCWQEPFFTTSTRSRFPLL